MENEAKMHAAQEAARRLSKAPAVLTPELFQAVWDRHVDPSSKYAKGVLGAKPEAHTFYSLQYIRVTEADGSESIWVMPYKVGTTQFINTVQRLTSQAQIEDIGQFTLAQQSYPQGVDSMRRVKEVKHISSFISQYSPMLGGGEVNKREQEERVEISWEHIQAIAEAVMPEFSLTEWSSRRLDHEEVVRDEVVNRKARQAEEKYRSQPPIFTPESSDQLVDHLVKSLKKPRRAGEFESFFPQTGFRIPVTVGSGRDDDGNFVFTISYDIHHPSKFEWDAIYREKFVIDPEQVYADNNHLSETHAALACHIALLVTIDERLTELNNRLLEKTNFDPSTNPFAMMASKNYGLLHAFIAMGGIELEGDDLETVLEAARELGIQPFPFGEEQVEVKLNGHE